MINSWAKILMQMLMNAGGSLPNDDPWTTKAELKGLETIQVMCNIRCASDSTERTPDVIPLEWLMTRQAERAGLHILEEESSQAPCLCALIHFAKASPVGNVCLFSLEIQLTKARPSLENEKTPVDEFVLWRGVSVCGVSAEPRLWHDIGQVLCGQVNQFIDAHREANTEPKHELLLQQVPVNGKEKFRHEDSKTQRTTCK